MGKSTENVNNDVFAEIRDSLTCKNGIFSTSDFWITMWYKGNDEDIEKTISHINKVEKWREENDLDNCKTWKDSETLKKGLPYEYLGKSRKNNPVYYVPWGESDVKKYVDEFKLKVEVLRRLWKFYDEIAQNCMESNEKGILILDINHFSFRQLTSLQTNDVIFNAARYLESSYGYHFEAVYIINAPRIWGMLFSVVRPAISESFIKKIIVYSDEAKMKKDFSLFLPSDMIPKKREISTNDVKPDEEFQDFAHVRIQPGQILKVEFEAEKRNLTLNWSFKTDGFDIGFALYYEDDEVIIESARINSHIETQFNSTRCHRTGKYTLVFDNSYSHVRSKDLYYMVNFSGDEDESETKM